jgi:2,3-bisphosphoglycerate-independent phosphoglycerate mutase
MLHRLLARGETNRGVPALPIHRRFHEHPMPRSQHDSTSRRPVVLVIRDGWGVSAYPERAREEGNATLLARTPVHDRLLATCPFGLLRTCGVDVGLPDGQMGNSEVGHLNLGAGRIVYQSLTRIQLAIRDGSFFQLPALRDLVDHVRRRDSRLHILGLCSDGGVHSHIDHFVAALEFARRAGVREVWLHAFLDGRDTSPTSGAGHVRDLEHRAREIGIGRIATITGRYFAMDRDHRWDRTKSAYRAMANGEGEVRSDAEAAVRGWYGEQKTDEFVPPTVLAHARGWLPGADANAGDGRIRDGDGVFFINFRADRARQITRALTDLSFDDFDRGSRPDIAFVGMCEYDATMKLPVAFPPQSMDEILGEVVSARGLRQLRIAETEKYAHVTFFFNGGREVPFPGEDRCLIASPKVATYDLQPEMSAIEVTDQLIARLEQPGYDLVILNYANPDMVGHTGSIPAAIRAVETIDTCLGRLLATVERLGGCALVTADHGNADRMLEADGSPFTAHTLNPVHCIYVGSDAARWKVRDGILADVAPTLLALLGLEPPSEMTGRSLLLPRA